MSSSKFIGIIERPKAERLLCDWANLKPDECFLFLRTHRAVFDFLGIPDELLVWRDTLRKVWDTQDRFRRRWYLAQMQQEITFNGRVWRSGLLLDPEEVRRAVAPDLLKQLREPPERPSPVHAALLYFEYEIDDLAKHCANADCERPYFIAMKRSDKFCSPDCGETGKRQSKRKWWNKEGRKRREARRKR